MGHSTEWYRKQKRLAENGSSKAKGHISTKRTTDNSINERKEQVKKRVESKRKGREFEKRNGYKASSKGLTYDHAVDAMVLASINQGRKGEGGRKKKNYG